MNRYAIPFLIFLGLAGILWKGLALDPRELPSQLIDKAAPAFTLPALADPNTEITPESYAGKVWLLNVWASWCVACLEEHSVITELSDHIDIVGLNYKDKREDALAWLARQGNPYSISGHDLAGNVGIDYGVYGVPETFVIDQSGNIRYKHTGPVSRQEMVNILIPIIDSLRDERKG